MRRSTKNMMRVATLIIVFYFASFTYGHDLFLNAHPFYLQKPGTLQVAMNLAESFPGDEQPWRKDKTIRFWMMGPNYDQEFSAEQGKNPLIEVRSNGTYIIGWNATPSYIEVDAKAFNEYIEADGYKNVIQLRKEARKENEKGREKYTRFLKSVVQVGTTQTDDYKKPLGQKIEIVPLANPYSIQPGSKLPVRVLYDSEPLPGVRVMATYSTFSEKHDVYAHTLETGPDGTVDVPIDQPGLWMIRANRMLPLEGDPKADW